MVKSKTFSSKLRLSQVKLDKTFNLKSGIINLKVKLDPQKCDKCHYSMLFEIFLL